MITGIDIKHLAGHSPGKGATEIKYAVPDLRRLNIASQRRFLRIRIEQLPKTGNAPRSHRVYGACGDAVHPNLALPQLGRQITHRGLQSGLRDTHDVVMRYHSRPPDVRKSDDGSFGA